MAFVCKKCSMLAQNLFNLIAMAFYVAASHRLTSEIPVQGPHGDPWTDCLPILGYLVTSPTFCAAADPSKPTNLPGVLARHIGHGAMAESQCGIVLLLH